MARRAAALAAASAVLLLMCGAACAARMPAKMVAELASEGRVDGELEGCIAVFVPMFCNVGSRGAVAVAAVNQGGGGGLQSLQGKGMLSSQGAFGPIAAVSVGLGSQGAWFCAHCWQHADGVL